MLWQGNQSPRVKKETKHDERKVGQCFQWKGQCSKGDSCSFSHDPLLASGNRSSSSSSSCCSRQRRKGRSSSPTYPIQRQNRLTEKKATKSNRRSQILCRYKICNNPSCKFWHLPVCANYKSLKGSVYGDKCHFRHVEEYVKPNKKSKKGGAKGSVAIVKEFIQ